MKRIFLIIFMLFSSCFGCLCVGDINAGFNGSSSQISNVIDNATNIINNKLIKEINKNAEDIKSQNLELEKLLKAYKEELTEKKEILFLLEKIEKLLK